MQPKTILKADHNFIVRQAQQYTLVLVVHSGISGKHFDLIAFAQRLLWLRFRDTTFCFGKARCEYLLRRCRTVELFGFGGTCLCRLDSIIEAVDPSIGFRVFGLRNEVFWQCVFGAAYPVDNNDS